MAEKGRCSIICDVIIDYVMPCDCCHAVSYTVHHPVYYSSLVCIGESCSVLDEFLENPLPPERVLLG